MPVYITEYSKLATDDNGHTVASGAEPSVAEQRVTVSGTSAQSAAFTEQTDFVMIHTTEVVCLKFGTDPTATNDRHRMAAGETRFYGVKSGSKVAVIQGT